MKSDEFRWMFMTIILWYVTCFLLLTPLNMILVTWTDDDDDYLFQFNWYNEKFVKYYCQLILDHDSCNMTVIAQRFWLTYFGLRYFMLHKLCILKSDSYAVDSSSAMFDLNLYFPNTFRKSRTRTKYFQKITDQLGPGPNIFGKSRSNSDQDQIFWENHGPTRTRTKHFREITDQLGPAPQIFRKSRTNSDQDQTFSGIHRTTRTNTKNFQKISNQLGPGQEFIWNLGPIRTSTHP